MLVNLEVIFLDASRRPVKPCLKVGREPHHHHQSYRHDDRNCMEFCHLHLSSTSRSLLLLLLVQIITSRCIISWFLVVGVYTNLFLHVDYDRAIHTGPAEIR